MSRSSFRPAAALVAIFVGLAWMTVATSGQTSLTRSVWDGVYTDEQAKRGEPMYGQFCASCHGSTLMGGEMAPALIGGDFMSNWNGLSVGDLFERIRISMPQNNPGSLSRQQIADIVAFMLRAGTFPVGKIELPRETEILKEIKLEPMKP